MKNKKFKTEYIVLAVVIVALTLYLVLRQEDRVQYELPKIKTLQAETIGKIEIKKPDGLLTLVKDGDNWLLGEKKYSTDIEKIEKMLKTISTLTVTEMVSQSKNYKRYGLHEGERLEIKAYQGDKLIREFLVGKNTATYGHTFVKLVNDDRVFQAKGAFHNEFNKKQDDIRDKKVMKFDSAEISRVDITGGDKTYSFMKSAPKSDPGQVKDAQNQPAAEESQWLTADGKEGDKSKIESYINRLSNLTCDKFIDENKPVDSSAPIFTITLKGNKDYKLSIFAKMDKEDSNYSAISSETPYAFTLASYMAENFTKDLEKLVKKKDK